ncbi:Uncharacterised protein [Staphylococcus aureus]|nr:Uncharacterised protein [Staphylococcus aureus]
MNPVRTMGIPKYLSSAPSIRESGGKLPKSMTTNKETINHVICVKVIGKGSCKSLIA